MAFALAGLDPHPYMEHTPPLGPRRRQPGAEGKDWLQDHRAPPGRGQDTRYRPGGTSSTVMRSVAW
eukprot:scaffold164_cov409-Prasinococcus_capsulatus_cf.AAC.4